jgi:hypothetical protein
VYCRADAVDCAALAPLLQESVVSSAAAAHETALPSIEVIALPVLRIEDGDGGIEDCILHLEVLAMGPQDAADDSVESDCS